MTRRIGRILRWLGFRLAIALVGAAAMALSFWLSDREARA